MLSLTDLFAARSFRCLIMALVLMSHGALRGQVDTCPINSRALVERSKLLMASDSFGAALRAADDAVRLAKGRGTTAAEAHLQYARVLSELGFLDRTLEHGLAAMRLADGAKRPVVYYEAWNSVGLAHYRMGHLEDARRAFEGVLQELGENGDARTRSFALNNLGMLEHASGHQQQALSCYQRSLSLKIALHDTAAMVRTFNNIGTVHADLGAPDSSLAYYRRSLWLKQLVGDRPGQAATIGNIGEVYGGMGRLDSAAFYLLKAKALADSLGVPETQASVLHNLAELYKATGDPVQALAMKEAFIATREKLNNERYARRVADLQVGYDLERKNANIAMLAKENEVRAGRQRFLVAMSILLLLGVVLLLVMVRARNRTLRLRQQAFDQQQELEALRLVAAQQENQKLSTSLDHKSRELASMATQALQKNQLLNALLEKVEAEERRSQDPTALIKNLRRSIKENIDLDADWDRFKLHFVEVHPRFFDALQLKSPGLGLTDVRHCAYIKLDLNTKEIARLLNIAPSSVQIARVRLKKKLGLAPDEDLKDFIRSIGS